MLRHGDVDAAQVIDKEIVHDRGIPEHILDMNRQFIEYGGIS
jgi:hypothetical protein